ncbi:hypothetical protein EUTSA_v10017873mg [Eutrema salsugineum]|uniref:BTB domain-containing protein n=1 Tax=Eutrema salsugineum TaxID=72664 RepID=V4MC54_EUTSA|nr:hypothetical protein EUTSA_v10017873mg [Eutrema salsugineum]
MSTQNNLDVFLGGFAKVLNEKWQVDLRLKAGGSKRGAAISVHKLVLVETVTLSELKQEELEAFVELIYSNRSVLSANEKKHAQSLYLAADKYEIPHLGDLCRNEIISSLNSSNALNVLEFSLIYFDKALTDSAAKFIVRNFRTICNSVEFKLFVGRNPDLSVEIMKASHTWLWNGQYVSTK